MYAAIALRRNAPVRVRAGQHVDVRRAAAAPRPVKLVRRQVQRGPRVAVVRSVNHCHMRGAYKERQLTFKKAVLLI